MLYLAASFRKSEQATLHARFADQLLLDVHLSVCVISVDAVGCFKNLCRTP